ncbi:MAG: glutaredoxin family protein [Motiliproteus sp.]
MSKLILYGTQGCHLCEVAEQLLVATLDLRAVSVEVIDIADDDLLVERYGVRIPVLAELKSGRELDWPFESAQLQGFVTGCS